MIFAAFFRALGQMTDPRFRRVLVTGVGLTLALLIGATTGILGLIGWLAGETSTLPLIGEVTWMNDLLGWGGLVLMLVLSVFLMVPVASAITSLFLEDVAQAVEDLHYPGLPPAAHVPWGDALRDTFGFLGLLIAANLAALLLYVLLPFAAILIFWGLNGFLLGREYFQLAAMRRIGRSAAKALAKKHRGKVWLAGIMMAMPLSIPLLNLVIPILGAATFTHLFHSVQTGRDQSGNTDQYRQG